MIDEIQNSKPGKLKRAISFPIGSWTIEGIWDLHPRTIDSSLKENTPRKIPGCESNLDILPAKVHNIKDLSFDVRVVATVPTGRFHLLFGERPNVDIGFQQIKDRSPAELASGDCGRHRATATVSLADHLAK